MKQTKSISRATALRRMALTVLSIAILISAVSVMPAGRNLLRGQAAAACLPTPPPTTYGQVKQEVNVISDGTYRVWSRLKVPSATETSYYLQIDDGCAYNIADATSPEPNNWTWINYQDGASTAALDLPLTAGTHTFIYTGKDAAVQLDRILLLADTTCVPVDVGDNCAVPDTTAPDVAVTAPTDGQDVRGTAVPISVAATDASGIKQVEFLIDGTVISSDTTADYNTNWDSTKTPNGTHALQAKAYDSFGNTATSLPISVTVNNVVTDSTAPTVTISSPAAGSSAVVGSTVTMSANAADNVGVTKVDFLVDSVAQGNATANPYSFAWNTTGAAVGTHTLTAIAYDAAGNSTTSAPVSISVTSAPTPPPPTPTPTPVPPNGLSATYFDNIDFTGAVVSRYDQTLNFDWGTGSPAVGIGSDSFSARWTGFVAVPKSGNYTFFTTSDDGVRLWVNDKLIVNNWTAHATTTNSGTVKLNTGIKYSIKYEYYDNTGGAVAKLLWSGPKLNQQVVPSSQLFPK